MTDAISDKGLATIHRKQNIEKYDKFFVGFLYGVVASGKVEKAESEALKSICTDVLSKYVDEDADDIIQDLEAFPNEPDEIRLFINDIIDDRTGGIDGMLASNFVPRNFFFGYLKGIACDNEITLEELQALIELGCSDPSLSNEDPRVDEVISYAKSAISDLEISKDENDKICDFISRIVGDAYADTGIGLPTDRPNLEGTIHRLEDIVFKDRTFVLTGKFRPSKKAFETVIESRGGNIINSVSKKVDYLVLANNGSRDYTTPNSGTKIQKAVILQHKHGNPLFIVETTLRSLIG